MINKVITLRGALDWNFSIKENNIVEWVNISFDDILETYMNKGFEIKSNILILKTTKKANYHDILDCVVVLSFSCYSEETFNNAMAEVTRQLESIKKTREIEVLERHNNFIEYHKKDRTK